MVTRVCWVQEIAQLLEAILTETRERIDEEKAQVSGGGVGEGRESARTRD